MRRSRAVRNSETATGSEGVGPGLPGPDPPDVVDWHDPYLAVTDLAGASRFDELLDHPVGIAVIDQDLDPDLGHEVDRVLGAPVHLGVSALPAEALDVGDGEALYAEILDRVLHVVDLERLDDAHDELHESSILPCVAGAHTRSSAYPVSECWVRSSPVSSSSSDTRMPPGRTLLSTNTMPNVTANDHKSVASTASTCSPNRPNPPPRNTPSAPAGLIVASAKKPSRSDPAKPPTRWTPTTSSESS